MSTILIFSQSNEPFFNIAAEEFLFKEFSKNIVFLYINSPSVIIGKHQNAIAEVNSNFIEENNIKVVRRISGGGAVFHDLGNLNFSFHQTIDDVSSTSFKTILTPMLEAIRTMGVDAKFSPRNDMIIDNRKFSGNAEHVFRNRVMCHGTLLFNANKTALSEALKVDQTKFADKSVKSVRSNVANLVDFMPNSTSMEEFINCVKTYFSVNNLSKTFRKFSVDEINKINHLVDEKYSTWEWNYGYSPGYQLKNELINSQSEKIECTLEIKKGRIDSVSFKGNNNAIEEYEKISKALIGLKHQKEEVKQALQNLEIRNIQMKTLSESLF